MKIKELFAQKKKVLSFELFPPKRDGNLEGLFQTVQQLKQMSPDYISITYGAGGSTRDMTYDIAIRLKETGILPLVHFTCVGHSRFEIKELLNKLKTAGIENLLALRGDPPKGETAFVPAADGFRYADQLVQFIRSERYDFCLGVAGYPEGHTEAISKEEDIQNLKRKVQSGGDFVVTQLFFDNQDYFQFVQKVRAVGVSAPIQPGIWILTDYVQIEKICHLSGAKYPNALKEKIEPIKGDKDQVARAGVEYAIDQCADLLRNGAPGVHFYVMNKSQFVQQVVEGLRAKGIVFG
ncbi:MAG TPA: methylenetetrahydrofolate reductase [NAD(P)H] [bacterium]|jgi:methylenetetrahydrofolate reductase (NADPH)|nr:methylenetetrahydrofolate reductase [NAD(P)H] [bacterium]